MQSKYGPGVIATALTISTGLAAALANYFLLPIFWTLPPTIWGSFTMAVFFGGMSWAIKYTILRLFNARSE